jgi:hypothetical protein
VAPAHSRQCRGDSPPRRAGRPAPSGQLRAGESDADERVRGGRARVLAVEPRQDAPRSRPQPHQQGERRGDTCFHEARHAEQHVLQARILATKDKNDAAAIQIALDIPLPVATAAFDLRTSPPDKAVLPFVDQWDAFESGGKHFDYKKFNDDLVFFVGNTLTAQPDPLNLTFEILSARTNLDPAMTSPMARPVPAVAYLRFPRTYQQRSRQQPGDAAISPASSPEDGQRRVVLPHDGGETSGDGCLGW